MRYHSIRTAVTVAFLACNGQPESPSSVLSADGVPIHYEVHGSGEPALVFVHGWSCDRSYWDAQVAALSDRHRLVTIDLAGHGESGLDRDVWSMQAFGQDVAAVVDELGLGEVVLVGHSMGGPVSVEAARILGDRVRLVVGADTFNDMSEELTDEIIEAWFQPFRSDFVAATESMVRSMFLPASDSALVERVVADMAAAPPEVGIGAMEGMINWWMNDAANAFGALQAPVQLINSDYRPTNVEAAREYHADVDVVLMSGVGHFVMVEDPETFNRLLGEAVADATDQ